MVGVHRVGHQCDCGVAVMESNPLPEWFEVEVNPSHDWFEIDEGDRVSQFCQKCDICACHCGDLARRPCPGEPDPESLS